MVCVTALVLVSVAQLQAAVPGVDAGVAGSAIFRASALVRAVARQQFDFVADDVVVLAGGGRDLVLPQRPVVVDSSHVLSVFETDDLQRVGVASVEGVGFARLDDRLQKRWRSQLQPGMVFAHSEALWSQSWPVGVWGPYVRVTYSHGFTVAPDWLTAVTLNVASIYATNPLGLYSEQVGGITLMWQRATVTARADIVNMIREELSAVGVRRGGAFSIGTS